MIFTDPRHLQVVDETNTIAIASGDVACDDCPA